ncbi:sugar ABC transporter permease [Luteimicrobium album]|uniref:Sugar ABC transporter permease n=1 Tax=Luteimicrobium album TaxID=1054550 RepID=A0ABQ6I3S6_9MICO|nr:sugar ABC transporter permease [Luteimicrobium album]GMA25435.1 sugar ABC transporter permease [Luteimicrobium album]
MTALSDTRPAGVPRTPVGAPAPRRRSGLRRHRQRVALLLVTPALLGLLIFFVYPLIATVFYSFTHYDLVSSPRWVGLANYKYLFTQDPNVVQAARNTLWFVVFMVPIRILCAAAVAALLTRPRRSTGVFRTVFYLPALVPPVASVLAFVYLFNPGLGPVNRVLKVFGIEGPLWFNDPHWAKPSLLLLAIWMMGDVMIIILAALLDVPRDQYEAASIDGAKGYQKAWYITVPNLRPVIVFSVVTGVIAALQYFTEAAVAAGVASGKALVGEGTGSGLGYPEGSTLTYPQWLYVEGFSNYALGYASALAVVLFVVAAAFVVFLLRRTKSFTGSGS